MSVLFRIRHLIAEFSLKQPFAHIKALNLPYKRY